MRMSHLASIAFACSISLFSTASFAQSPSDDGLCDELHGATPSLYGLCIAYWATQSNGNSDASSKILEKYTEKQQIHGGPDMPGLEPCGCWTTAAKLDSWKNNLTVPTKCEKDSIYVQDDWVVVTDTTGGGVFVQTYKYYDTSNLGSCSVTIDDSVTKDGNGISVPSTSLGKNSSETCYRELVAAFCEDI